MVKISSGIAVGSRFVALFVLLFLRLRFIVVRDLIGGTQGDERAGQNSPKL